MKIGQSVLTKHGKGTIQKHIGRPPKKGQLLVRLETDKFWPHWNFYFDKKELKALKTHVVLKGRVSTMNNSADI